MGNVQLACEAAGVSRVTFQGWKERNTRFAEAAQEAFNAAADFAEAAAYKRAVFGVQKNIWMKDESNRPKCVDTEIEFSDRLMEKILEAKKPSEYGRKMIEMSGPGGAPLEGQRVQIVIAGPDRRTDKPAKVEDGGERMAKELPPAVDSQGGS